MFSTSTIPVISGEILTFRLFTNQTGAPIAVPLTRHIGCVGTLAFSSDCKRLASESDDETIQMWNAQTGTPIGEPLTGHRWSVNTLTFSPHGERLASESNHRTIQMWDLRARAPSGELQEGRQICVHPPFLPDGKRLDLGSEDRAMSAWDAQTGLPIGEPLAPGRRPLPFTLLAFSADGKRLASWLMDATIRICDV
ncbi:hypothetical protein FRB90_004162 [Tulasnella sp. 427]|nr:hypothetical protein FRB90_004162 [Tulasnella sp. 427]